MSRPRKAMAARGSTGRILQQRDPNLRSPAEVRRLVDAALAGLRSAEWASQFGQLHLNGKITAAEFSIGQRWAGVVADYDVATQSPQQPRSAKLERGAAGQLIDPDSEPGTRRHVRTNVRWQPTSPAGTRCGWRARTRCACSMR
jgi:hypothetical protein